MPGDVELVGETPPVSEADITLRRTTSAASEDITLRRTTSAASEDITLRRTTSAASEDITLRRTTSAASEDITLRRTTSAASAEAAAAQAHADEVAPLTGTPEEAKEAAGAAGTVLGCVGIVTGTTVGAGILAIPAVTAPAGFVASSGVLLLCWAYMLATGLLMVEVHLAISSEPEYGRVAGEEGGADQASLDWMVRRTLGAGFWAYLSRAAYLFLHYSLLTAYIARAASFFARVCGLPPLLAPALFACALGGVVYALSARQVDMLNGALATVLLAAFGALLVQAAAHLQLSALEEAHVDKVMSAIPVIALAFVYHTVVPVVCVRLKNDLRRICTSIAIGSLIPLVMFTLWDAAILAHPSLAAPDEGSAGGRYDPVAALERSGGGWMEALVEAFSLAAVSTSFLGFMLGLSAYLADLLGLPPDPAAPARANARAYAAALVPPLVFATVDPSVFFSALNAAGVFGVLVLFGLVPAAMAWTVRYSPAWRPHSRHAARLVPGGRPLLAAIIAFAGGVIGYDVLKRILAAVFKHPVFAG